MRVVYFSAEMFNDAMFFIEKAKSFEPEPQNDWLRWRYLRATILYTFACLESVINGLIIGKAKEKGQEALVKKIKEESISLIDKVSDIYPGLIGISFNKNRKEWNYFMDVRKIRNLISHYTGGTEIYNDDAIYGVNISNAEKSIEMVRIMVTYLYEVSNMEIPQWVYQEKSKIIK